MSPTPRSQLHSAVDAELFLGLSAALKDTYQRVSHARVSPERRRRLRRRLLAIVDAATYDLGTASDQLSRFAAELDRDLGATRR